MLWIAYTKTFIATNIVAGDEAHKYPPDPCNFMNQTLTLKSVSVYFLHRIQIHTLGSGYLSINPLFNDIF